MAVGDVYFVHVPGGIGWHSAVVLRERTASVVVIYGQTEPRSGAFIVCPGDAVAGEFGGKIRYPTHFHKNNLALIPTSLLPEARLGHVDDGVYPDFEKAAKPGFILLGRIDKALEAAGHQCQCQGGCSRHEAQCTTTANLAAGRSLMDWRMTPKNTIVCRPCWDL